MENIGDKPEAPIRRRGRLDMKELVKQYDIESKKHEEDIIDIEQINIMIEKGDYINWHIRNKLPKELVEKYDKKQIEVSKIRAAKIILASKETRENRKKKNEHPLEIVCRLYGRTICEFIPRDAETLYGMELLDRKDIVSITNGFIRTISARYTLNRYEAANLSRFPNLRTFKSNQSLQDLKGFIGTNITDLTLTQFAIKDRWRYGDDDPNFAILKSLPLTRLNMPYYRWGSFDVMPKSMTDVTLLDFKHEFGLWISYSHGEESNIRSFKLMQGDNDRMVSLYLPRLQVLHLEMFGSDPDSRPRLDIDACTSLTELNLPRYNDTKRGLRFLKDLRQLKRLFLNAYTGCIKRLAGLPLEVLHMSAYNKTSKYLAGLPLTELYMNNFNRNVEPISKCPKLRTLSIQSYTDAYDMKYFINLPITYLDVSSLQDYDIGDIVRLPIQTLKIGTIAKIESLDMLARTKILILEIGKCTCDLDPLVDMTLQKLHIKEFEGDARALRGKNIPDLSYNLRSLLS